MTSAGYRRLLVSQWTSTGKELRCRPVQLILQQFHIYSTHGSQLQVLTAARKAHSVFLPSLLHSLPRPGGDGKASTGNTNSSTSKMLTADASLPTPWHSNTHTQGVQSKPLSEMAFCYPFFQEGGKIREKTNKLCSFSVCEKQAVPYSVLSKASFFPTAIIHF